MSDEFIRFGSLDEIAKLSDEEIVERAKGMGFGDGPSGDVSICARCGYERRGRIEYFGRRYCDCDPKITAARYAIREIDPVGEMRFDNVAKDSDESFAKAAAKLEKVANADLDRGLFLLGLPGRGKTHLQIATARLALENGRLVGIYSLASLVGRIQETYGYSDGAQTKSKILDEVASHEVVILDDVGKEHRSADTESIVYQLVDLLYRQRRILVASSNLPGKDFVERYDGAVLSRLGGMCERVVIRGEDRRKAAWSW